MRSSVAVNRTLFRLLLVGLLLVSAAFAAWTWMRPYEWQADIQAQCRIEGCEVEIDHSNYWLRLHLKVREDEGDQRFEHDMMKPVRLVSASGREIEPADTTLSGDKTKAIQAIWLKFWLKPEDFDGPLTLKINDGRLSVRSDSGPPKLRSSGSRNFVTENW